MVLDLDPDRSRCILLSVTPTSEFVWLYSIVYDLGLVAKIRNLIRKHQQILIRILRIDLGLDLDSRYLA